MSLSPALIVRALCALACLACVAAVAFLNKPWTVRGPIERIDDFAVVYEWWAAAVNAVLFAVLTVTAPWWVNLRPTALRPWLPPPPASRTFLPLLLLATALLATMGIPRLSQSLWDDEDSAVRRGIYGEWKERADGTLRFSRADWTETLWNYKKPANQMLQAILSKTTLEAWRAVTRPAGLGFSEAAARIPVFLIAILAPGVLGLLLRRVGFSAAGVVAAFLLALHPWMLRYASELRGYGLTLLLGPLLLFGVLEAVESGRWRWWFTAAATGFALLYAYPGCLYLFLLANAAVPIFVFFRCRGIPDRLALLCRWAVASTVSGAIFLQLMLPCIPQFLAYLKTARALGEITTRWHANMAAHLAAGIPWNNSDQAAAGYPELRWHVAGQPVLFTAVLVLLATGLVVGTVRLATKRPAGFFLAAAWLVPGALVYVVSRIKGMYLYEWYLIFSLPGLVGLVAVGITTWTAPLARIHRAAPTCILATFLLLFATGTHAARARLIAGPLQAQRESVLLTRPTLDPFDPRQKNILTVNLTSPLKFYDPLARFVSSPSELAVVLREADSRGIPVFVNYGNAWSASAEAPELFRMIEDDRLFEKTATLQGFDPTLDRFIRKYRSGRYSGAVPPEP